MLQSLQDIVLVSLFFGISWLLLSLSQRWAKSKTRLSIPRIGLDPKVVGIEACKQDFLINGYKYVQEGYKKYKDSMYLVQTADMERIVLSNKFVEELRVLPESKLSTRFAMCERHLGHYTTLDVVLLSHLQNDVCKVHLTQNMPRLIPGLLDESGYAFEQQLGDVTAESWTDKHGHTTILDCITHLASRAFVNKPLCRNPSWLETATGYTLDVFALAGVLRDRSWLIRPLLYLTSSARTKLHSRFKLANSLVGPILQSRMREQQSDNDEKPADLLQWLLENAQGDDRSPERLIHKLLFICLASIHTSTMSACHALYDLCQYPEYAEPLRQEIKGAIREHGSLTYAAINNLRRLDSFIKESQRINHPGSLSFNRKVLENIQLSDGTLLPKGSFITMPTAAISMDPQYYPNPQEFRPWRYFDLRSEKEENANRYQFTSTSASSLPFGHGKFACPGRFFAAGQIKLLLAMIILHYDVKWPEGQVTRPQNVYIDERIGPNRDQIVCFRQRKEEELPLMIPNNIPSS